MVTICSKIKLITKCIKEKYSALKEVEEGKPKYKVALKYGVLKNTLSTLIRNKRNLEAMEQGYNPKCQNAYANLDSAIFIHMVTGCMG